LSTELTLKINKKKKNKESIIIPSKDALDDNMNMFKKLKINRINDNVFMPLFLTSKAK
jgi:hypothetical protein